MQTIEVSDRAAAFIERCRDFHQLNQIKAGIADLFAFALADITAIKQEPYDTIGLETLAMLVDVVNEFWLYDGGITDAE